MTGTMTETTMAGTSMTKARTAKATMTKAMTRATMRWVSCLVVLLVLGACDSSPTEPALRFERWDPDNEHHVEAKPDRPIRVCTQAQIRECYAGGTNECCPEEEPPKDR